MDDSHLCQLADEETPTSTSGNLCTSARAVAGADEEEDYNDISSKGWCHGCGRWAPQPQPHLVSQCLIVLMSRCPIGLVSWCPSVPVTWCPSVSVIAGGQRNTQFFGHTDRWTDGQRWYPPKNHANSDCFKNLATYYYHQVTVGHFKQQHSISDSF